MKHHYKDSSRGFGVTSPLWDYIFNTLHKDVKLIDSNEISEKYVNNKDTIWIYYMIIKNNNFLIYNNKFIDYSRKYLYLEKSLNN